MENVLNVRIAVVIWLEPFSAGSFCPHWLCSLAQLSSCLQAIEGALPPWSFLRSLFHTFPSPFWLLSVSLYSIGTHKHFKSLLMWVLASLEWNWFSNSFRSASLALWRSTEWRRNQRWPACSDRSVGTLGQIKRQWCRKQWLGFLDSPGRAAFHSRATEMLCLAGLWGHKLKLCMLSLHICVKSLVLSLKT